MEVPWDIFWESRPVQGQGRRFSTTSATRSRCRCSGTRCAPAAAPTSTPRTRRSSAKAGEDLGQLTDISNVKVTVTDYQTLPEGKSWLNQAWSGDLLSAAFYYMPKGVPPSVLSYWSPETNGVVQNDFFCIGRTAKNPALAHRFIDFMIEREERLRQHGELRRRHAAAERDHRRGP